MKRFPVSIQIWLLSFVICSGLIAYSFGHIDIPIALHFRKTAPSLSHLNTAFGAAAILTLEAALAVGLILFRLVRGHISPFGSALAIACLASISSYGINSEVLKPLFGVPVPAEVMQGARHGFNFLLGTPNSSFPSGHMVLAGAFAGVFMSLIRVSIWPLAALLALGAVLLIIGDWHFLSDVIAGGFVGLSAGILAGEAWATRTRPPP